MVYLIGVDHLVQYNGPVPEEIRIEFRSYLIELCRKHRITIVAEEFSEYALRDVYHATADTACEAASFLGIEHRYCDPGEKELAHLGIPFYADALDQAKREYDAPESYILDGSLRKKVTRRAREIVKSYWLLREQYWYEQIRDVIGHNIVFVCGHEHIDRFRDLLVNNGHGAVVIEPYWKKGVFSDYSRLNLG